MGILFRDLQEITEATESQYIPIYDPAYNRDFKVRISTLAVLLGSSGGGGSGVTSIGLTSSDITVGGSSPITSTGTFTLTLPIVNSNVGTFNNVTVNAKGQVTAASNVAYLSNITGYIQQGTNVVITGAGTLSSPYIIASSGGGGGGGSSTFITLLDVPTSYSGQAGKLVRVNGAANALEFFTATYLTTISGLNNSLLTNDSNYITSTALTPYELLINKATDFVILNNTKYPSTLAVDNGFIRLNGDNRIAGDLIATSPSSFKIGKTLSYVEFFVGQAKMFNSFSNINSELELNYNGTSGITVVNTTDSSLTRSFQVRLGTNFLFTGADAIYSADYSSLFGTRSLVDKGYTDSKLRGLSLPTPVSGNDTQSIRYNHSTTSWEYFTPGGGGATAFIGLSDVPGTYFGQALKLVRVNAAENALEFFAAPYQDVLTEVNFGAFENSLTAKTTPIDADLITIVDSADSNKAKKVTWANIKATLKVYFDALYLLKQITTQTGTTYTLANSDTGKILRLNNATGVALTIPLNASVPIDIGFEIDVRMSGAGPVSFVIPVGVTINGPTGTPTGILTQYDQCKFVKQATDSWMYVPSALTVLGTAIASMQVLTTAIASTWAITTGGIKAYTRVVPAAGSSLTAISITFTDLINGGEIQFEYKKTTATDCVMTFPANSYINDQNGNEAATLSTILTSSATGVFHIVVTNMNGDYFVSIQRKKA